MNKQKSQSILAAMTLASVLVLVVILIPGLAAAEESKSTAFQAEIPAPYLLKDINEGSEDSYVYELTPVGDGLFFRANDGSSGMELWKSDGTVTGTVQVRDICTGTCNSHPTDYDKTINVNNMLFFIADDGQSGQELWKSDGTYTGTILVKDICPGSCSSDIFKPYFATVGSALFFAADDGSNGQELWKSDGTYTGTIMVKDICSGSCSSFPQQMTNVSGTLYFVAEEAGGGRELWKSDGTVTGTVRVKDIWPGSSSSLPGGLTDVNGTLFFTAKDGSVGGELWRSDGTETGTVLVKDIRPGSFGSDIGELTVMGETLFFSAHDGSSSYELWKSDGTYTGTILVKDICPGAYASAPTKFTPVNNTLFFLANDGSSGYELWKSDGTEIGTSRVKDIVPGSGSPFGSDFEIFNPYLTVLDHLLLFVADDGSNGKELWVSDGTETGTVQIMDINPGAGGSNPRNLATVNGRLFFGADDGTHGEELWTWSTGPDLVLVKSVTPGTIYTYTTPFTYTLTFSNTSQHNTATSVVITDIVPVSITMQSIVSSGVAITDTGIHPGFVWTVQDLAPGDVGVITITGVLSPGLPGCTFDNNAIIISTSPEFNVTNNSSTATLEFLRDRICFLPLVLGN